MAVRVFAVSCLLAICATPAGAKDAKLIYGEVRDSVFQILIIERESEKKAAIGSGFLVNSQGLIATNFHVISQAVHEPDKYRVEHLDSEGQQAPLAIVDFDVIHDLALVKLEAPTVAQPLELASADVTKGEAVYSVGNPMDLGQTIVPGTFNGLLERRFYQRLLFSGSLNPGMSGGPALNSDGQVIGINVASSGNQISFLVPVKYLLGLTSRTAEGGLDVSQYQEEIERQLVADQEYKYKVLIDRDWTTQKLGEARVAGDLNEYFKCWGNTSDDEERKYTVTQTSCSSEDAIFISRQFHAGAIDYQYGWVTSEELNTLQFHTAVSQLYSRMYTRNRASEDDVTNYQCGRGFIEAAGNPNTRWRSVFCVRQYKRYRQLYDVLYMGSLFGEPDKALSSHFALSGVTKANAIAFAAKFLELQSWDS